MKFKGKVCIGITSDGKNIYKCCSADTKEDLELAKEAIREHFIYGRKIPKNYCFAESAEEWYRMKKEPFISNSSKTAYITCFHKYLLPEFGMQKMEAIDAHQVQAFVNGLAGKSKSWLTTIIGTLRNLFISALAEGVIQRDPTAALIRPKAARKKGRRPLTKSETKRVLKTINNHPEGLYLGVLYYLGVRRGEALGLKWGDFDWTNEQVHIQRDIDFTCYKAREDTLKTEAADRFVPIPEELKQLLLPHKGEPDTLVFHTENGDPLSEKTFKRMWARLMVDCGCVEWRDKKDVSRPDDILSLVKPTLTPHYFRHNYVTLLYESGVDPLVAMMIVGHTDYQTTANIYTHIRDDMLKKATVNMEEVFAKKRD